MSLNSHCCKAILFPTRGHPNSYKWTLCLQDLSGRVLRDDKKDRIKIIFRELHCEPFLPDVSSRWSLRLRDLKKIS